VSSVLVRFYGRLAEEVQPEFVLPIAREGLTIGEVRRKIADQFSGSRLLDPEIRAVLGDEVVQEGMMIFPGDEVEFLAPLSGG
jgi:molybdopterin converting factor small subunit